MVTPAVPTPADTVPTAAANCQTSHQRLANFEETLRTQANFSVHPAAKPALVPHYKESCMTEHIVAVFETETAAAAATESLRRAAIPSSSIRQYAGTGVGQHAVPTEQTSTHTSGGGFWAWLFGEEFDYRNNTLRPYRRAVRSSSVSGQRGRQCNGRGRLEDPRCHRRA